MFIGHFAVAYILIAFFPAVPPLVVFFGVSFPDLLFYAIVTILAVPLSTAIPLLALGIAFHLINANSFLGFSKRNPFTARQYAVAALFGFLAFIAIAAWILPEM